MPLVRPSYESEPHVWADELLLQTRCQAVIVVVVVVVVVIIVIAFTVVWSNERRCRQRDKQ